MGLKNSNVGVCGIYPPIKVLFFMMKLEFVMWYEKDPPICELHIVGGELLSKGTNIHEARINSNFSLGEINPFIP